MMNASMSFTEEILSQIPGNPLNGLRKADELWKGLKNNTLPLPNTVKQESQQLETIDYDVVICGGTLGILIGTTLAMKGWRVAVLERGKLRGREHAASTFSVLADGRLPAVVGALVGALALGELLAAVVALV